MTEEHFNIQTYQKHIQEISNDTDLISGIYNYCDRWCERCGFTNRCSVYRIEDNENNSFNNGKHDLDRISEIFTLTMEMLNEIAEEYGLDLHELPDMDFEKHKPGEIEKLAIDYGNNINKWLKTNRELFEQRANGLAIIDEEEAEMFSEVIRIINWYSFTIGAKIHRASVNDRVDYASEEEYNKRDQVGSAKIALISIDHSMNAMKYILNGIPDMEEDCLNYLAVLQKMKHGILEVFPNAMDFIRPGFDEG